MKLHSAVWILTLSTALSAGGAYAHGHGEKGKDGGSYDIDKMSKELKLTDDQQKKIKAIHEQNKVARDAQREKVREAKKALRTAMESDSASDDEIRAKFKSVQEAKQKMMEDHFSEALAIRKILSKEQRVKFREHMKEGWKGRMGSPPDND